MVLTEHLTDYTGTLLVGAVVGVTYAQHTIENAAVHRLESVPHVRQGTGYDYRHGVVNIAAPHLTVKVNLENPVVV
jgi:hypothetical protein